MQTENKHKKVTTEKKRTKTGTRIVKWLSGGGIILILLVVFLVPALVSSESGRRTILAKANKFIEGKVGFAGLSMGWWKGIRITGFSFDDNAGQISVRVKQIATKPHYGSILLGSLSFGETIIDEPRVEVNLKSRKTGSTERQSRGEIQQAVVLPIKEIDLVVKNGNVKVTDERAETVEFSRLNTTVNLRPPGEQTKFDANMTVGGEGKESKIIAGGRVTPGKKTGWSLKGTSGELVVEVNNLDVGSLGPIFALAGAGIQGKGLVSGNIESEIKDGRIESLSGTIKGKDLDVTGDKLKGDRLKSSRVDVAVKMKRQEGLINIERLWVDGDWVNVDASGSVPTTLGSVREFLTAKSAQHLTGSFEVNLGELLSQMPRTFGVREGLNITSGRLSGNVEVSEGEIRGQASLTGLGGVVDGKAIALSEPVKADVEITSDETGIRFDKLDVSSAFGKINCSGSSELMKYEGQIDLAKLQEQVGQFVNIGQYRMAGEVLSKGQVASGKDKINVVSSSVIKNFNLRSAEGVQASEPMAEITVSASLEREKGLLNLESIQTKASFGEVSVKDAVLRLDKKTARVVKLPISANVDLQKLRGFAVLFAGFPKEMQLSGTAQSDIAISSDKDSYYIRTDNTKIENLKLNYPEQKAFEQSEVTLAFDAEINPIEKTIAVKKLQLISPQIKLLKGELNQTTMGGKTKLEGQADFEYDWAALSTVAGPVLPRGLNLEGQRKDTIKFASEYPAGQTDKLLGNLNTKAKLGFVRAEYMGLNFGPTEIDMQVVNGLLRIAPFSAVVNNGQVNFAGEADFKQEPTLLKTAGPIQIVKDVQINDKMARKLLGYVNPIFANAINVNGVANFNCERLAIPLAKANSKDIEVIGTISMRARLEKSDLLGLIMSAAGASARGEDIIMHPTRFVLRDGLLRYDDMQIDVGNNPINFRGVIGLDKSLDMSVTLPYTLKGRTARAGEESPGKRITVALKGTTDKPELDVRKMLEEQAMEKGVELLKGLLKK
jgi:hypothetical protein